MRMWSSFSLKPFQGGGSDDIARVQINLLPKFWSTNYKFVTSYPFAFELIMKHCIVADRYIQGLVMQMRQNAFIAYAEAFRLRADRKCRSAFICTSGCKGTPSESQICVNLTQFSFQILFQPGCFFHWPSPKKCRKPRLGESTLA